MNIDVLDEFDSAFCHVTYLSEDNVVFLTWKKFCRLQDYREPTMFAAQLLRKYVNSNFIIDARNGFEDDKEDVEWGFSYLLPEMAKSDCEICVFIVKKVSLIDEEIDLWTKEFLRYFIVKQVHSYEEAIKQVSLIA